MPPFLDQACEVFFLGVTLIPILETPLTERV